MLSLTIEIPIYLALFAKVLLNACFHFQSFFFLLTKIYKGLKSIFSSITFWKLRFHKIFYVLFRQKFLYQKRWCLLIQLKNKNKTSYAFSLEVSSKERQKKAYFIISKKPAMWNLRNVFATDILLPTTHDYRWIMFRWRKVSYIKIS